MSGIFKGDSIYKSGGGGGGYKDGGQLFDGDFIKVENNTISSYDNVSRDPVNFYFEVKDGEVLNSVVELTTAVNATINVYVVKNGFYYLLGNVGGNTVNAGEQYKLNVVGDSFALDQVTTASNDPKFVSIMGQIYGLAKIGGLLWTTENLRYVSEKNYNLPSNGNDFQEQIMDSNFTPDSITTRDNVYYRWNVLNKINELSNFRIPTNSDMSKLDDNTISQLTSIGDSGTNTTKFNALFKGRVDAFSGGSYPLKVRYMLKPSYYSMWGFWSIYDRRYLYGDASNMELKPDLLQGSIDNFNSTYFNIRLCIEA